MKTQNQKLFGHFRLLGLALLLAATVTARSQTNLSQGHTDIGIAYDVLLNEWDLHVHDHDNDIEYSPATNALLVVKSEAHGFVSTTLPFLGPAGSDVWTLPTPQNPNLLFLGFGGEEINPGMFVNDQFTIALKGVTGPGTLAIYDFDLFGNPVVWMNSRDGISGADSHVVGPGLHQDLNFAFSAPGDYTVLFEASGNSVANGITSSGDAPYLFRVVPEPSTISLAAAGALLLLLGRRAKQKWRSAR